jgi:hypothetical protein
MFNEAVVVVEEGSVPLKFAVAVVCVPTDGVDLTVTVVPTGILLPANTTLTGFFVLEGRSISGELYKPLEPEGGLMPAMETIVSTGMPVGITADG